MLLTTELNFLAKHIQLIQLKKYIQLDILIYKIFAIMKKKQCTLFFTFKSIFG